MVDERDFQILSQLRKNPFLSYESLGREMGLSGNAVKSRLEALEKAKILPLLHGMPASRVFHRFPRLFFFREPVASQEKLEAAIEINPTVFVTQDVDQKVGVLIYDFSSLPKPPEKLVALLGPTELEVTPLIPHAQRELSKPLSSAELKVLRVLIANLRVPLKELSQITGLSQKVTKKIRTQLLDDGLLQVQPIFQSAQSQGILMYEVDVHYDDAAALPRIKQALPKSVIFNQWEPAAVVFSCWAESLAEVFETEKRLKGELDVREVRVKFHLRAILSTSRLISWIDEEIQHLERDEHR